MTISKDLIAASATPLVLSILSHGDSYGYDIIQRVGELSDGGMKWADGMLYPILHRLEKKGLVESYWGAADNGRKRKYYRLRKSGLKELNEQRKNWHDLYAMLQKLEGGSVCSI
ncbi:MAG: helix-turn-helix transcriptional regulator [Deltaproteobacteria bacterium]|nr:helix-turn-helix transcriptional regulator [Deltaproteobacteria bacterium]